MSLCKYLYSSGNQTCAATVIYMDKKHKKLLEEIKSKAVYHDWNEAFGGKSYGNNHLFRVNTIAKYIIQKEGGDEFIALASAWVHDVALSSGKDDNPNVVYNHTVMFLKQFDLTDSEVDRIADAVSCHESGRDNLPIEAQIVHDADVVDKSGMLGVIRHIWKMTNLLENRVLSTPDLVVLQKHLKSREKNLYTNTGRRLAAVLNSNRDRFFSDHTTAAILISEISQKAYEGKTSDEIALDLCEGDRVDASGLYSQLKVNYIK